MDTSASGDHGRSPAARPAPGAGGLGDASVGKIGMWVFLATDAMGFAGLLLAYAVLRARATAWPDPAARSDRVLAAALTVVLVASGATMTAAVAAARAGRASVARALVAATLLCGIAFVAGQAAEFVALVTARHVGLTTDHASAIFFLITGYHGVHVVVGALVLLVVSAQGSLWRAIGAVGAVGGSDVHAIASGSGGGGSRVDGDGVGESSGRGHGHGASAANEAGVRAAGVGVLEVVSLYWQFVDLVWIVVFTSLYLLSPVLGG